MSDFLKSKKRLATQVLVGFVFGLVLVKVFDWQPYGLVYNTTASIPKGVYLTKRVAPSNLAVGDIACFAYEAPAWAKSREYFLEGRRLCKVVFGLAGQKVFKEGGDIWVGSKEQPPVAKLAAKDSQGRDLPQDALTTGTVPVGHVLMLAPDYPNSFDSRYLGYIPEHRLTTRAWPLLTF